MAADNTFIDIDNLLPIIIITLCGIFVILGVITYLSMPRYSGSLHTTFGDGDPFARSQLPYINFRYSLYDGFTNFPPQGYTPNPVPCTYSFIYDDRDASFANAIRAGIVHDGLTSWNG